MDHDDFDDPTGGLADLQLDALLHRAGAELRDYVDAAVDPAVGLAALMGYRAADPTDSVMSAPSISLLPPQLAPPAKSAAVSASDQQKSQGDLLIGEASPAADARALRMRGLSPRRAYDPERIGRYQVLGRIGSGAMGQVYLARSPGSRLVAVKTIHTELADDGDFRRRFAREVTAARRVGGAYTAPVVDADPDADVPWLATLYLPVPTMAVMVEKCGPLPVPTVRWLAAGCAEALESIHRAGLIHRDLKPGNVLVAADGPRVIDFGLVHTEGLSHLTATGDAMGTPSFMAPEQASGLGSISPAVDVFSLGATLMFALTGTPPYRGRNINEAIFQMMRGTPDLSVIPEEMRPVLAACLRRDPDERPTPAQLVDYFAPHVSDSQMPPPLPASALRLIDEYGQKLIEELVGEAEVLQAETELEPRDGVSDSDLERELDRFLEQGPVHEPILGVNRSLQARVVMESEHSRLAHKAVDLSRGSRVLASVAVVVSAFLAGSLGYSLHSQGTTQIVQSSLTTHLPTGGSSQAGSATGGVSSNSQLPTGILSGLLPGEPPQAYWQGDGAALEVNPPYGDDSMNVVLLGTGWPPGRPLTLSLGGKTLTAGPIPGADGTFAYLVNANHEFFPGAIPPGTYKIEAIAGNVVATVTYTVIKAPSGS